MWRKKTMQKEGCDLAAPFRSRRERPSKPRAPAKRACARPPNPSPRSGGCRDCRRLDLVLRAALAREDASAFAMMLSDPDSEKPKIVTLYQKLIEAHNASGESAASPLTCNLLNAFVRKKDPGTEG